MKLIHLGDLHFGKSLGDFDLIEDQKYIIENILNIIDTETVDGVLIAGDVYDRRDPSEAAINLLDYFLTNLAKRKVSAFLISGNHDSDDKLNYGSSIFKESNIFISSVFDGTLHKETLTDEYGETDIYLMPFVKASQVRHFYPEDKIESYDDAIRTIIAHTDIDSSKRNVIIAHQFVTDENGDPRLGGSESTSTQSVGLVEKISFHCFDAFDYAALGHIHSAQAIGRDEVRYSGSPLKYSLSEADSKKYVPLITLEEKGSVKVELLPLKPMRDLRHIRGPIKELLDKRNVTAPDDYIYATLTDEDVVNDAMGIFQQYYPRTVRIDYDNSHTREIEHADISQIGEIKEFPELIRDFYRFVYSCEITDEEMQVMLDVAKEAKVYEAD